MNKPSAILRLRFTSEDAAEKARAALAADDDSFVSTTREGNDLVVRAAAADVRGLLRALDDVLANAAISEDLIRDGPVED